MTMIPLYERTRARRLSPQSLSRAGALLQRMSASAGHFLDAARLSCGHAFLPRTHPRTHAPPAGKDRTNVVSGKRVSVRVELGGRRILKKKHKTRPSYISTNHTQTDIHTN